MPLHSELTGADLHEPKGVETATVNTVYKSNGAGSGTWSFNEAEDVTLADPGNVFAATNVEDALAEIQGSITSLEAADIAVTDPGSRFTATNVETTLAEIHDGYLEPVTTSGKYRGPTGVSRGITDDTDTIALGINPSTPSAFVVLNGATRLSIGTQNITSSTTGANANNWVQNSEAANTVRLQRYSNDAAAPEFHLAKARGTTASPSATQNGDSLGGYLWRSYGTALTTVGYFVAAAKENHSGSALGTYVRLLMCPVGSATVSEFCRFDHEQGFQMYGSTSANTIVDPNRAICLRSRTVAELGAITPTAGRQFFCSDESGGAVPVFGDGTNWRRVTDRAIIS